MSTLGKGVTSIRKKDLNTQKSLGVGIKKLVFYHQATAGDTGINLLSLVLPSSLGSIGKTNPSASAIQASKLYFNQDNFILFSSLRGWIMPSSFVISSSSQITFVGFTASDQEIFIGYLDNIIQGSLRAADVNPINATGSLAVGTTDFAVSPFTVGLYPTTQIGSVIVVRNGKVQMRNVGNATAAPGADGNYQEVAAGGSGQGSIIRFNVAAAGPNADAIMVFANGALIEQPTDSQMAYIEVLAGQINSMIPVLADAAGVPTSTFGSNPSSVDLRNYGDYVIRLNTPPTQTILTSGSGTYTAPANTKWIKVRMVGGGGGGAPGMDSAIPGTIGTAGGNTTFGSLTANGGGAGNVGGGIPGVGGTASVGAGFSGIAFTGAGGNGLYFQNTSGVTQICGASGGSSPFGGAGSPPQVDAHPGGNAVANTGSGGCGGGSNNAGADAIGGTGGGAGGYVDVISTSLSTSYSYSVGSGGTGGIAGTANAGNGGNGGSGVIIIEEHYGF